MVFEEHDYKNFPELSNRQIEEFGFMSPHKQITEDFKATVVKVHDGDTITLRTNFRDFDFPLRILGIDAPEMNAGGEVARDWLSRRILNSEVQIIINEKKRVGKFGRLLGIVFHRGMDIGLEMTYLGLVAEFGDTIDHIPNLKDLLNLNNIKNASTNTF